MRSLRIALALLACCPACGRDDDAKAPAAAPAPGPEPTPPPPDPPAPAGPSRADAESLDARTWWHKVARGEIEGAEVDGDRSYATLRDGGGEDEAARMVVADTASLQDARARDAGYGDAVESLVLALRTGTDRSSALARLEALTKTQRGPWENWLAWHDDNGDFLTYNADLDRVDVDAGRKAARTPVAVGGLVLRASLLSDRVGHDAKLQLKVQLHNASAGTDEAAPIVVNQRMALGHELIVEIRAHEDDDTAVVPLRPPGDVPPLTAESFARLDPGQRIESTFDLQPRLSAPLEPGRYMVRVTYRSDAGADGLGLAATPWTGEIRSVRNFVRVVPW